VNPLIASREDLFRRPMGEPIALGLILTPHLLPTLCDRH